MSSSPDLEVFLQALLATPDEAKGIICVCRIIGINACPSATIRLRPGSCPFVTNLASVVDGDCCCQQSEVMLLGIRNLTISHIKHS